MQALRESARAFERNRRYSRLGAAVFGVLPNSSEEELMFDPEPIYDACLGQDWFLMTP